MNSIIKKIKKLILRVIRLYQGTLSPDHGFFSSRHPHGFCKFYPTCSEYAYRAIDRHGIVRGAWKGVRRIIRCNPFSRGGYDPIK